SLWRAAEPTIIARPGSRVILCSSPWGGPEHFFRQLWQRGMDRPDALYASWHWTSSISPLVDAMDDGDLNEGEALRYFLPFLEARFRCSYADWIARIAELAGAWLLPVI